MRVVGAHPGKFRPSCDRCFEQFLLMISPDPEAPPMVMAMEATRRKRENEESRVG